MKVALSELRFHDGGYCRQLAYLSGRRSARIVRFHAIFVSFVHPEHGACVIDAGYGPAFWRVSRSLPERIYRWATPVSRRSTVGPVAVLERDGIEPSSIRRVIVSHWHGDHVGGLREFSDARIVHRQRCLAAIGKWRRFRQVRHGVLWGLIPDDLRGRSDPIDDDRFRADDPEFEGLASLDYWGDGSLILLDLPGHAPGHTGFVLRTDRRRWCYVVDACWDIEVLRSGRRLPWIGRQVQHDFAAYERTQTRYAGWMRADDSKWSPVDCPRTLSWVGGGVDSGVQTGA